MTPSSTDADVPVPGLSKRPGPNPIGATFARVVGATLTVTIVALQGDDLRSSTLAIYAIGFAWLVATAALAVRRGWTRGEGRATAFVDLATLIAVIATTGGSTSSAVYLLWLAPLAWVAVPDPKTSRILLWIAPIAYFGLWLPDGLDHVSGALRELGTFAGMYAGSTAVGLVTLHLRLEADDQAKILTRARAALMRQLGQVEQDEHERLSIQLHDGPLQMVISARQDLAEYLEGDSDALALGVETLDESILALRAVIGELYPDDDACVDVASRLAATAKRLETRNALVVNLSIDSAIGQSRDEMLVAMVGELMTNVGRHAQASTLRVAIVAQDGLAVVEVSDDGIGMTPQDRTAAERGGHIGLRSLDRRVRAIGGRWRIRSAPGRGTIVRVELPR